MVIENSTSLCLLEILSDITIYYMHMYSYKTTYMCTCMHSRVYTCNRKGGFGFGFGFGKSIQ